MSNHHATLIINHKESEKKKISANFSQSEWDIFHRFIEYNNDLEETELIRKGGPGKLSIKYDKDEGFSYSTELPNEDHLLALLHRLRPFILSNEDTNFNKVSNILKRRFNDSDFNNTIGVIKSLYSGKLMQSMALLEANNIVINSEATLKKWLNAYEYHKDLDKQKELELVTKIFPFEAARSIFIMMLYDMYRGIALVSNILKVITDSLKKFNWEIK